VKLSVGDEVKVYDSCYQYDVVETIVKIEDGSYGELIYTVRGNWLGYDERIIRRSDIKEHFP